MFIAAQAILGTPSGGGAGAGVAPITTRITGTATALSGTEAVPTGAVSVTIKGQAPGGGGGLSLLSGLCNGGGAGGYFERTIAVTGEDGETLSWTLGAYGFGKKIYQGDGTAGGDVTVTSTTLANWTGTMTAHGGEGGQAGSAGGSGGTASGGTTNTTGGNATHFDGGDTADGAPGGSAGVAGVRGSGGGPGTFDFENSIQYQGGNGGPGWIEFIWT